MTVSFRISMEAMEPMAPTAAVAVAAVLAHPTMAVATMRAVVVVMADLAAEVEAQGQSARSSVAVMEGTVDLVAAQASASAPTLICTANRETGDVSEEVVMAVAVAVEAELWEAPSSMTAVRSSSATVRLLVTMWIGGRVASTMRARTERVTAGIPARQSSR